MNEISPIASGMRALGATALVLGLLLLLAWAVRRGSLRLPGRQAAAPVRIETAVALGERRSLVIIAVEGRRLLLGVTPGSVSVVTELQPRATPPFEAALDRQQGMGA